MAGQSFVARFFIYQQERFPVLVHVPLIMAFSFSAIGYSKACRGVEGFIAPIDFAACVLTNVVLFFMLRVADEHKDRVDDALYRKYLPVPRGLISLKELSVLMWVLFVIVLVINIVFYAALLGLFALMMLYLLLMRYEFFVADWLKKRQVLYVVSHMAIIPLADVYASSYDWQLNDVAAPTGLMFFLAVSYLNGVALETGRKIRVQETEEEGVVSYTKLWGVRGGAIAWLSVLTANFILACIAEGYAHNSGMAYVALAALFAVSSVPGILFLIKPTQGRTKFIELVSLLWALGMYLVLGGIPLLLNLIGINH